MNRREIVGRIGLLTFGVKEARSGVSVRAASTKSASQENPYAYDVARYEKTDPRLVRYSESARFSSPLKPARRLAIGPDGHLYFAGGDRVSVLRTDGSLISEIATAGEPQCVAVSKGGIVYVGLRERIELHGLDGRLQATWEVPSGRPYCTGLALSENDLFAADSVNRVVIRYDLSGKIVGRIGAKDEGRGIPGLVLPSPHLDVEFHDDGLLRVNNPGRHRVEVYTVEGELTGWWGKPSAAIDGFCGCCNPVSIAMLHDGRCVTCEKGLPRVKVYAANGRFESVVAGVETFSENARAGVGIGGRVESLAGLDAAVDRQGRVFVLDRATGEIHVMTPKMGGAP